MRLTSTRHTAVTDMKKLRKAKVKKGKAAKLAQRRLDEQMILLESAKECHLCGCKFNKVGPDALDWHVRVAPDRELRLTCTSCLAGSNDNGK